MLLSQAAIEKLKHIAGSENVISDAEDLYVYSFEGPLGMRRGPTPSAVIRLHSEDKAAEIAKLAKREGLYVARRSEAAPPVSEVPMIIIDLKTPPSVKALKQSLQIKGTIESRIRTAMHSSSFQSWFTTFLPTRLIYRCSKCPESRGTACSGYCTVGPFFDGVETWSAKGRLLLSRGLFNGDLTPTKKLVDSIYTCSGCGQCYDQCVLGELELYRAIILARHEIAKKGLLPELFKDMPQRILEYGTPLRMPLRTRRRTWWLDKIAQKPKQKEAEVLYWSGCIPTYRFPRMAIAALNLLRKANVDFAFLGEEEGCCGYLLLNAGLWNEAMENAAKVVEKLVETGAKTLVTGCAGCYYTFKRLYPEILKVQVPLEVMHLSQFIEPLVEDGDLKFKNLNMTVTYHDPCDLGRHCGVYEPPRNAIRAIPGVQLTEMDLNRSHSRCCGAGAGLWTFNTSLAMNIARLKLIENVLPLKVEATITTCPACHMNLKYTSKLNKIDIEIYDLAEILEKASL